MDNHFACVNCVRWSNAGTFLASAGDDKLIMIWRWVEPAVRPGNEYVCYCVVFILTVVCLVGMQVGVLKCLGVLKRI